MNTLLKPDQTELDRIADYAWIEVCDLCHNWIGISEIHLTHVGHFLCNKCDDRLSDTSKVG
jgi:hypothetical protein